MQRTLLLVSAMIFFGTAFAQPEPTEMAPPGLPESEPPPPAAGEQQTIEPEVTIIRRKDRTVEEYRINGELYMIKVTPSKGVPYYLMDTDGDGSLETQRNNLDPNILVPSWVIFRW